MQPQKEKDKMMCACEKPIEKEWIECAKGLSVSLLLDGAKAAGIALERGGCLSASVSAVNRGHKMVGTAVTVKTQIGDNQPIHLAIYGTKEPGYVLVIDGGGYDGCAYMGDLMLGACKALGFAGVVIDGRIRDYDGVINLDFPVYTRGFMPLAPTKTKEGEVNTPVSCGGIKVNPGDLVMGDCDGVCVIPREHVPAVLEAAIKRRDYEAAREEAIREYVLAKESGLPLPDLTPAWAREILERESEK